MDRSISSRGRALPAAGIALCTVLATAAVALPAPSRARRTRAAADLNLIVATPLGLQGTAGAGPRTVLPFRVFDRTGSKVTVEVQVGFDRDGDGVIADGSDPRRPSEFVRATQQRRDARDTGRLRVGRNGSVAIYRAHRDGAAHGFVWDSVADLGSTRHAAGRQTLRDETGRAVPDPYEPGATLLTPELTGVKLRVRATKSGRRGGRTEGTTTDPFPAAHSNLPSMRIDGIVDVDETAGRVAIDWTGFDDDSEDRNGNGVLDVLQFEDRNGNGVLDVVRIAVHFDFHRLTPGAAVPVSEVALAALAWEPCSRASGEGDADVGIVVSPAPFGGVATFVWDTRSDLGLPGEADGRYLVRATPYDAGGGLGRTVYLPTPIVIGTPR